MHWAADISCVARQGLSSWPAWQEGVNINHGLLTLGKVISALVEREKSLAAEGGERASGADFSLKDKEGRVYNDTRSCAIQLYTWYAYGVSHRESLVW